MAGTIRAELHNINGTPAATANERTIAQFQGRHVAEIAAKLAAR